MDVNYFSITPASVRYDRDLPPNAKLLYGEITALANAKGYCWASNEYFADLYEVTKETVSRWISQLHKKGHIDVMVDKAQGNKRYISIAIDKNVNRYRQNNQEVLTKKSIGIDKIINTPCTAKQVDATDTAMKKAPNSTVNSTVNNTSNIYSHIFDYWNDLNIIKHRKLTTTMKNKIKAALQDYSEEEIKESMKNYSYILNNDKYYFNYKWTLDQYCTIGKKDRIAQFLDLEVAKSNNLKGDYSSGEYTGSNGLDAETGEEQYKSINDYAAELLQL